MNALEEKLLQRMVSDFETAEPLICSLINIVIPALCLRSTLKSCPPFLPRIPGGRNDTSRRWHGCHSSTIPLPDKLADNFIVIVSVIVFICIQQAEQSRQNQSGVDLQIGMLPL